MALKSNVRYKEHVKVPSLSEVAKQNATYALGAVGVGEAKSNAAVKTGRMRNQIRIEKSTRYEDSLIVISPVEYSAHVEFGTRNQKAQPFMGPSEAKVRSVADKVIQNQYKKVIK